MGTTLNGFYSLANVIASPIVMGSQALSNSLFKNFSQSNHIPRKVFLYNTIWLIVSISGLYLVSDWVISLLFGEEFSQVNEYILGISIAFFFQGLYQPFNFLSAKSQTVEHSQGATPRLSKPEHQTHGRAVLSQHTAVRLVLFEAKIPSRSLRS